MYILNTKEKQVMEGDLQRRLDVVQLHLQAWLDCFGSQEELAFTTASLKEFEQWRVAS
jgi:hypothetical protein